ncbi:hypothetical protein [Acetobacter conturbans]|uniref:hypothetical protein n=1 Tax=Acetobacter conturbans TaxID=1737472 RepID=UPI00156973BB|nr:hypothetical protein [Acetobacter conturbans]
MASAELCGLFLFSFHIRMLLQGHQEKLRAANGGDRGLKCHGIMLPLWKVSLKQKENRNSLFLVCDRA